MRVSVFKKKLFLVVLIATASLYSAAQICINKYAAIRYKGTSFDTFTHLIVTANNELISAGGVYDYNKAGHIAKFSEKGTPIWSYLYNLDFYDFVKAIFFKTIHFSDIINTADGGFIVAGNIEQVLSPFGLPPPVKKWALMAKMDKFGKVIWTKTISNNGGESNFSNIYQTSDGDFIAYLSIDNGIKQTAGDHSYGRVLRIDASGKIKWSTFLFTYLFDAGGLGVSNKRGITQASNKNIIIADIVHKTIAANGQIKEGNLHFFELDYATGKVNWETSYEYPAPANDTVYMPDIVNVTELPGGQFSFITSLYLPTGINGELVKKGANIFTSNKGVIENVIAYAPADGSPCRVIAAAIDKNNGNRTLLMDKEGKAMLVNIDDKGKIVWKQGYSNDGGNFPVNCFAEGNNGYNIFRSNNRSKQTSLVITATDGSIDCVNEPADILAVPAALNYSKDSVVTNLNFRFDEYYDYAHPLKRKEEYPMLKNIDCQQTLACCTDIIDSSAVNVIAICEGKSYLLPDSTIVKEAGTYDVTFKTALGCDSIVFYKISIDKDVAKLILGEDTCLTGQQTISLRATEGYDNYLWMKNPVSKQSTYLINQPGRYYVNVTNVCGSKTDSIEVFDQCDYKVFMPTAFTPNGDGLNDYFRIAPTNKNKLLNFSIYNRRGNLIFQSSNSAIGWDGTFKSEPQSADTFVYYLEMIGLSGNRISQKGTVVLIR